MLNKSIFSFTLITLLTCFHASAAPRVTESDIHKTCSQSPKQCLKEIDVYINEQSPESRKWFQLLLYKFEAQFQLVEFEQLHKNVEVWVEREDVPLRFRINVLIYYAKTLHGMDNIALGSVYMDKAIKVIEQVNEVSHDPMLLIQIANGLNYLGEYQKGYDLLAPLIAKYRNRHMAHFKHELFENIGHFAAKLGKLDDHLSYRLQALDWAREMNSDTQIAIALYNTARAHQMLNNYERAFHYFSEAENSAGLGKSDGNLINFRRAELALAMNDINAAEQYFSRLNRQVEFDSYTDMFEKFEQELKRAKEKAQQ